MPPAPAASPTTLTTRSLRADDRRLVGRRLARQQRERFGLQAVAGEYRNAFAVHARAASAVPAAACHRPWPGDRRGSASRCGSARWRTRPATRSNARPRVRSTLRAGFDRPACDRIGGRQRQHRAEAVCRRRRRCSASHPRQWPGRPAAGEDSGRARRRPARARVSRKSSSDWRATGQRSGASDPSDAGAGFSSPRSFRTSIRRSASSRREWQNRDSFMPRS